MHLVYRLNLNVYFYSFQHFIAIFPLSRLEVSIILSSADGRLWLILLSLLAMRNPLTHFLCNLHCPTLFMALSWIYPGNLDLDCNSSLPPWDL